MSCEFVLVASATKGAERRNQRPSLARSCGPPGRPVTRGQASAGKAEACPRVTSLLGGTHDLADKALRFRRSAPFVADTAGTDKQVIVARIHWKLEAFGMRDGAGNIDLPGVSEKAPADDFARYLTSPTPPAISARRTSALLSRHPRLVSPCPHGLTPKDAITHERLR